MPNGMLPPGYRAVLIGSSASIEGLHAVTALEESADEGTLMLMRLDFLEYPAMGTLGQLEDKLRKAGVPAWPGNDYIVYADVNQPMVYLAWQKRIAWMPIIIGILVTVLLPTLLGGLIWALLPSGIKEMIEAMVMFGVVFLMMSFVPKLVGEKRK